MPIERFRPERLAPAVRTAALSLARRLSTARLLETAPEWIALQAAGRRPCAGVQQRSRDVQDAVACLPRLADAVDLAVLGETGIAVTVVIGAHRFDLKRRLDRATLWRVLVAALPRPGT